MLYAREVIELMGAYPGRDFKMAAITRHVAKGRKLDRKERRSMRAAVRVVLLSLQSAGSISIRPPSAQGSYGLYVWNRI